MISTPKILIVDDDRDICQLIRRSLQGLDCECTDAYDGWQALEQIETGQFDLVVLDLMLPGPSGIEILRHIRQRKIDTDVIVLTAYASLESAVEAIRMGAHDYITKPFNATTLRATVEQVLEKRRLAARLTAIYNLSREILLLSDVKQICEAVLATIKQVLEFQTCALGLIDEERNEIYWLATCGVGQPSRVSLNGGKGITAAAVQAGEPIYVPDVREDPRYIEVKKTTRSELAVPLEVQGRVIGVLNIESDEVDAFSPHDIKLLSILAAQTAVAIENARLYNTAKTNYEYYRAVTDSLHDEVLIIDRDYRVTDVNAVFLRRMGYTREEVIGRHCYEVTHNMSEPCCGDEIPCPARQVWESGQPTRFTQVRYDREGIAHWLDVAVSPLRDPTGRMTHIIEAYRDMTTERQLEERLSGVHLLGQELVLSRDEQQISQVTVDAAIFLLQAQFCGMWVMDVEENRLTLKAHAGITKPTYQYAPLVNDEGSIIATVARTEEPVYVPDIQAEAAAGPSYPGTGVDQVSRTVLCVPLKAKGKLIGVLTAESNRPDAFDEAARRLFSILADYSALALENARLYEETARLYEIEREQRKLMEQSRLQWMQSEKLAAMGRLAASLAHEINNPLQALRSGLSLLMGRPLSEEKRRQYLEIAHREVERLITIVEQILNFSRPSAEQRERTDINALLKETLALAGKQLQHARVTVRHQLAPKLPPVEVVAGQIKQVFLNIILNALDAMPDGGELTVATGWDRDRRAVWIAFTDNGVGIPAEDISHIFEPFFTRKPGGTGLGLTISYSIIERHGGRIEVESQIGRGSTFTVFLPV